MNPIKQEPVDENYGNFSMAGSDWTLETSGSDQEDTILHENEVKIEIPDELADVNLATLKEQHQKEISELKAKNQAELDKAQIQMLQANMKNLDLEAKIRALEENAEQNAKYQALEAKVNDVVQMLSTQNEQHHKEMEQLQDEFSKMLAEKQKQMMAQFQAQFDSMEQKQKEAEQRAKMGKNELEEIIQQKLENFQEEMNKNGQQIGNILSKLEYRWNQLMAKNKILANPKGIVWDGSKKSSKISECGLKLEATDYKLLFAIATEGYTISGKHCPENFQFPETIVYYYEVTITNVNNYSWVGFTDGSIPPATGCVGHSPNSYGFAFAAYLGNNNSLWLSGEKHELECPTGIIAVANVIGSGLLLNSKNELAVFFTRNGILLGKQIRINPTVDRLYPTVFIECASVEANFGSNLVAKPFNFDTDKCPGLVFE